ncbi:TPA: hypothetical protein R5723_000190 [Campylobacter jejuni]|nr:hypothetical protein [Campylobacter jejuni]ECP8671842.1 hypothetical protein [Campylobacter jejuni]ECP9441155.1 hypothetical protein [Campylobacter jejuni]HEC2489172.1 hypothetical protein [Campylobacter jejuni]HEC2492125.1 hypothetical protein [Campylobacter jejuni]
MKKLILSLMFFILVDFALMAVCFILANPEPTYVYNYDYKNAMYLSYFITAFFILLFIKFKNIITFFLNQKYIIKCILIYLIILSISMPCLVFFLEKTGNIDAFILLPLILIIIMSMYLKIIIPIVKFVYLYFKLKMKKMKKELHDLEKMGKN